MATDPIRRKVGRVDVAVVGSSGAFSKNEPVEGVIKKIALVSGTMISGNVAIVDNETSENIWSESSVSLETTNPVRYPKVSGSTVLGVTLSGYDEEFVADNVTVAFTGIVPTNGTATCYLYFQ